MSLVDHAKRLAENGLSIIPIRPDGSKAPAVHWKKYQSEIADERTLRTWFSRVPVSGLAVVAGSVSGNLEILDFDEPNCLKPWQILAKELGCSENLFECTPIVRTPSGGYHIFYRFR